jgi:hypothetical protein
VAACLETDPAAGLTTEEATARIAVEIEKWMLRRRPA